MPARTASRRRISVSTIGVGERGRGRSRARDDGGVHAGEQARAGRREDAEDLAAVGRAAPAGDEPLLLEPVDQARDARGVLDHAPGDLERRQGRLAGAAQDAQHVVLLVGDAEGLEDAREMAAQDVDRLQEAEGGLVARRRERAALLDLAGEGAAACHEGMNIISQ